ncbi:SDR family NAD(P)-dependent oxidoreductase [Hellea balneolensis]|uniref:SDR family NAD(P)-dependent oxidoreductase n=1 Tax=Hellea balneolensis TaxID=287478 RepID=UPI0003F525EA|nr:SDR family NAD(P)-dependent oxidoreductase [Hellea balneolensis]
MTKLLPSMGTNLRVVIVGSTGGIGAAFVEKLAASEQVSQIYALSRQGQSHPSPKVANLTFDFTDETSIEAAAEALRETGVFDLCIIATGLLQGQGIAPEKNMRAMSLEAFNQSFIVNTFGPAVTAKHFLPLMRRDGKAVLAALSARVGSISDNRIGGWYAYRASKAALNMILKTLSIEFGRRFKETVIIGLHPGTVDTGLSKPFQSNVPEGKLFTPEYSAEKLLEVIEQIEPKDSGSLFAWDGKQVPF